MIRTYRVGARLGVALILMLLGTISVWSNSTVVRFSTTLGDFEAALYDSDTPVTVSNFLAYVESGAYTTNLFFHRSAKGFVLQGGGFYVASNTIFAVPTQAAITNEPGISNVRGTIAMAKIGSDPNSATSQWFFNLTNNSANLDVQNGGFTVFGRVIGNGMVVVDALADVPVYNYGAPLNELPLLNPPLVATNLLYIHAITQVPFALQEIRPQATGIQLEWIGPDSGVRLERANGLLSPTWSTLAPTNQSGTFLDTTTNGTPTIYRLSIP
jgi:cyclophilin family peptidyl-prolyl cis-trans isomerase